ncbi:proprotein convertase subtilisin/kexin type 4-like [Tiliqua scincoides]|uniref:proprotein convertase subtilisin/kexin type 4-like n=1 Tax=Tiliqua scincoides TaxID=71010 RepID=UPI003462D839
MELGLLWLLLCCGFAHGRAWLRFYLSSWAVRVPSGAEEAQCLARRHGLLFLGQVIEGEPYYHLQHRGIAQQSLSQHRGWYVHLKREPCVHWFEQQTLKRRVKRSIPVVPTDPWFQKQWYMNNDMVPDLNVLSAWSQGYTGMGVVVSILDDGIEKDHPDLVANYDPLASYDFNDHDPDPQPRYNAWDENRHGTRCAGEVAATANNDVCGAGIAYRAKIGGVRMLDGPVTDIVEAQSLSLYPQHIDIYSASWGPEDDGRTVDGPGTLAKEAFLKGIVNGRRGLGSLFVWASGNGGLRYDNCNCDGYTNSIYTLSVGSTTESGRVPWYSEACASTLTTTYSSGNKDEEQIVTTDLRHTCTDKHTGTSASAPLAAGMIALALEANPALSWRDMQHLVVRASKPAHLQADDWSMNGVGRKVSHHYGYGLLDAGDLVDLAKKWATTRPQRKCSIRVVYKPLVIGSRLAISKNVTTCPGKKRSIYSLEHVQVQLTLSYSRRGDLAISLTSPLGTKSTLVALRPYDTSKEGYKDWSFMSTHYWDEDPQGVWTLLLENKGDAYNTGLLSSFVLKLYGTDEDMMARQAVSSVSKCVRRNTDGTCQECTSPFYAFQSLCLSYCPPRYYSQLSLDPDGATRVIRACAACHSSCYTCQGGTESNCTACSPLSAYDALTRTCSHLAYSYQQRGGSLNQGPHTHLLLIVVLLLCVGPILFVLLYMAYGWLSLGGENRCWKLANSCAKSGIASLELVHLNPTSTKESLKEPSQKSFP